jgi:hypothetical protein
LWGNENTAFGSIRANGSWTPLPVYGQGWVV